ncbi:MAG: YfhO family protein, partial [Chloroflexota bacterium]
MRVHSRLPLLILALALAAVFYRLLLGEAFFWGLPSLQFYPWREYAFDLLRAGHLPLWNSLNGAGTPLFANYQSSLLYPLSWIGFVLPLAQTMSITAVLHLFIAGWGMWRFTGELKFSSVGSGVSALAFGMTAYLMARLGTYPVVQAAAWLPWMLWATLRILDTGRPRSAGLLALFTALLLLAGHAQTAWYSLLLTGLFAVWWTIFHRPIRWPRLAIVVGCMALGAGIAALQLLATAELLRQSQRSGGVDFDYAMNYSYAPARILNMFAPDVFGTPANETYITGGAFFEDAVYVGLIPMIAALAAILGWLINFRRKAAERLPIYGIAPFWVLTVIVAFVFALGVNTPIFPFLYRNIPTFNLFQGPVRWHLWTVFGLSILAGIGVTAWGRSRRLRRWAMRLLVACGAATVLAILALIFAQSAIRAVTLLEQAAIAVGLLGVVGCLLTLTQPEAETRAHGRWSLIVLVVVAADLVWAGWGLNPTVPASFYAPVPADPRNQLGFVTGSAVRTYWAKSSEETVKFEELFRFDNYRTAVAKQNEVRASQLPNLNMIDHVPLLNNFEPLLIGHFAEYIDLIETHPTNSLLKAADVGAMMYQLTVQPAERAWLLTEVCWHQDEASLKAAISDPNWKPDQQLHMLGEGNCDAGQPSSGFIVSFTDLGSDLMIKAHAERDSWLVLADTDYPGWHASVDGVETPIYRANLNFRAIQVDAGTHDVRFDYRPDWLLPGALVSAISLLIAL